MDNWSDLVTATKAVVNPKTSPTDLAAIAGAQPSLWIQIVEHPHTYPELMAWLSDNGGQAVKEAVARRQAAEKPLSPPPPQAQFIPTSAASGVQPTKTVNTHRKYPWIVAAVVVLAALALILSFVVLPRLRSGDESTVPYFSQAPTRGESIDMLGGLPLDWDACDIPLIHSVDEVDQAVVFIQCDGGVAVRGVDLKKESLTWTTILDKTLEFDSIDGTTFLTNGSNRVAYIAYADRGDSDSEVLQTLDTTTGSILSTIEWSDDVLAGMDDDPELLAYVSDTLVYSVDCRIIGTRDNTQNEIVWEADRTTSSCSPQDGSAVISGQWINTAQGFVNARDGSLAVPVHPNTAFYDLDNGRALQVESNPTGQHANWEGSDAFVQVSVNIVQFPSLTVDWTVPASESMPLFAAKAGNPDIVSSMYVDPDGCGFSFSKYFAWMSNTLYLQTPADATPMLHAYHDGKSLWTFSPGGDMYPSVITATESASLVDDNKTKYTLKAIDANGNVTDIAQIDLESMYYTYWTSGSIVYQFAITKVGEGAKLVAFDVSHPSGTPVWSIDTTSYLSLVGRHFLVTEDNGSVYALQ